MEYFSAIISSCAKSGLVTTPFIRGNCCISYLLFTDVVLIFAIVDVLVAGNLEDFRRLPLKHKVKRKKTPFSSPAAMMMLKMQFLNLELQAG